MSSLNISQFPPAGPISGAELIGIMQGGITKQTTVAAVNQSFVAPQPLGSQSLSTNAKFQDVVATAPLVQNYQFGSGAGSGTGITPIRNQTDLTSNFNPFEDITGTTSINSELQRFQPFNSANHQFMTDRLQLNGLNPNNDWNCTITQIAGTVNLNNTPTGIAALGLANTSALQVGQMAVVIKSGTYVISAMVPNVSVTFQELGGSPTTAATGGLICWLPIVSIIITANYVPGSLTFSTASLPTTSITGYQISNYNQALNIIMDRNEDVRVQSTSAGTVTMTSAWTGSTPTSGQRMWFQPVITSGQVWSKQQFDITNPQTFFALECHVDNYGGSRDTNTLNVNSLVTYNALPPDVPWGGWATFWCYSADDGNPNTTQSIAEIDILEPQISVTQGVQQANTGNFSTAANRIEFNKVTQGFSLFNSTFNIAGFNAPNFAGDHLWQLIFCNGRTYKFLDGELFNIKEFVWSGQKPCQFGFDLALGTVELGLGANGLFPRASTNFAGLISGIKSFKVWYQAPG